MGECFDSDGFDYKEAYYRVLSELNDKRGLEQHSRALFWSRLFACYLGGCLMILLDNNDFSSLQELLTLYAFAAGMGVITGLFILFISGLFETVAEYETSVKSVRNLFFLACLIAPLVLIFVLNLPPEP